MTAFTALSATVPIGLMQAALLPAEITRLAAQGESTGAWVHRKEGPYCLSE